ncbi:MAG: hypothetical protein EP298_06270 [Gammaproteobacteria bacterium]|nr:MAG: hypothetical protein EP298_06270 [Gammaproteobacteria bacterium]UTW41565.1 hypothetical protein KFE69_08595 [bacterium SCSIO 12844]
MGLFDQANTIKNGKFYRQFSQAYGSKDLETYFSGSKVAQSGICSGSGLLWIRHYLTNAKPYSNEQMLKDQGDILTAQKAVRVRDQSLRNLLIECGMKPRANHLNNYKFKADEARGVADLICSSEGINTISYHHPKFGNHVVTCFVDKENKQLYFSDVHKGDVTLPYPASIDWLTKYFEIFHKSCGEITVTHFESKWNEKAYQKTLASLTEDAKLYDKPKPSEETPLIFHEIIHSSDKTTEATLS